jgi:hypothetical protein
VVIANGGSWVNAQVDLNDACIVFGSRGIGAFLFMMFVGHPARYVTYGSGFFGAAGVLWLWEDVKDQRRRS